MKGSNFPDAFRRIVAAERKKLTRPKKGQNKRSAHNITFEDIMNLPFIAKHYHMHRQKLISINQEVNAVVVLDAKKKPTTISRKVVCVDYDSVFNAVQFFQLLIDLEPSPVSRMIRDEIPDIVIETVRIYINFNPSCIELNLFVELFLFFTQLSLVDCHSGAVGRSLDQKMCTCIFDFLYSQPFKKYIDITKLLKSQNSKEITESENECTDDDDDACEKFKLPISLICMYSIWTLRNLAKNSHADLSFLPEHNPLPMVFHLIFISLKKYCSCCSSQHDTLTIKYGLNLVKNLVKLESSIVDRLFHHDSLCELCIRLVGRVWLKCSGKLELIAESIILLESVTDSRSYIVRGQCVDHMLKLEMHKFVISQVNNLSEKEPTLRYMAVRVIANLAARSGAKGEKTSQALIDAGVIPCFFNILKTASDSHLCKEACWALSNLCAGTLLQTCQTISWNNFEGFKIFLKCMSANSSSSVSLAQARREAAWAVINTCHRREKFQSLLSRFSVVSYLCKYCYLQMAKHGDVLGNQVAYILDIFDSVLSEQDQADSSSSVTLTTDQRDEIANTLTFLAMFVPDVHQQVSCMIDTYFYDRWTSIDSMD
jgi:hypothetical protein